MFTWKRITVALVILICLVGTGVYFGVKFYIISKLQNEFSSERYKYASVKQEKLELVPVKVEDEKYTQLGDKHLKFKAPLSGGKVSKANSNGMKIEFDNGRSIIYLGSKDVDSYETYNELVKSQKKLYKRYFGVDETSSEYNLRKAIYNCTPDQLDMKLSFGKIRAYSAVLTLKSLLLLNGSEKTYYYETEKMKGFMHCGSSEGNKSIILSFYSDEITCYTIWLKNFTEEDAKYILSSIEVIE